MMLEERLEHRFEPVFRHVRERFGEINAYEQLGGILPWDVIRGLENLPTDEDVMVWLARSPKREIRPIVGGYEALLEALKRDDPFAEQRARAALDRPLAGALAVFARWWFELYPAPPTRPFSPHPPHKGDNWVH